MSAEIKFKTAKPLIKAQIVDEIGQVWDGSAMAAEDTLSSAEWTAGLITPTQGATTDPDDTGLWLADWPGGLTQDALYTALFYSGAAPAPGDLHVGVQQDPTEYHNVTAIDGSPFAAQVLARKNFAVHDEAYVVVAEAATDTARGTALGTAYAAAKALTPGGEAISITNRATVLIPPGRYALTSTLDLDTDGVDLIALRPERGADRTLDDADASVGGLTPLAQYRPPCTEIYTTTNNISTVTQSASNVKMRGFAIAQLSETVTATHHALYVSATSNEGSVYEDMYFWHIKPLPTSMPTGFVRDVRGTWRGCIANAFAYRLGHHVEALVIFSATTYDCQGGAYSFIGDPVAYGIPTTKATGCRLVRCKAIGAYNTTGRELGQASFSGCGAFGLNIDANCYFEDCIAGVNSFGLGCTNAGNYVRCFGEDYCFGATLYDPWPGTFAGTAIDCRGGKGSFGGRKADAGAYGTLAGTIINCQVEDSELPWRIEGATIEGCLLTVAADGEDCITLLDSLSRVHNSTLLVLESGTGVPINAASALMVSSAGNRFNNADTTASGLGANVTNRGVGVTTDPASREASKANVSALATILNRLGAWTGAGRNNILGAFQALFRQDVLATVPSDVNVDLGGGVGTASNVTDSVEAIRDTGDVDWITGTGGGGAETECQGL